MSDYRDDPNPYRTIDHKATRIYAALAASDIHEEGVEIDGEEITLRDRNAVVAFAHFVNVELWNIDEDALAFDCLDMELGL